MWRELLWCNIVNLKFINNRHKVDISGCHFPSICDSLYLLHLHIFIIHLNSSINDNNNNNSCIMPEEKLLWHCTGLPYLHTTNKVKIRSSKTHIQKLANKSSTLERNLFISSTLHKVILIKYTKWVKEERRKQGELSVWRFLSLTMLLVIKGEEGKLLKILSVCVFFLGNARRL